MAKFWLENGEVKSDASLDDFDENQMGEIRLGLKKGLDISVYADSKFNWVQMSIIRDGLEAELDVSIYADPKYNASQMRTICYGLEKVLDISVYADPKFDAGQMYAIMAGSLADLHVSIYADPKIDRNEMDSIRYTMVDRVIDAVIEDFEKHGIFVDPGEVDLWADGIYVDNQKVTTMDDLKTLYPELEFNRESLSGQTTDDREVDDEEESLDDE